MSFPGEETPQPSHYLGQYIIVFGVTYKSTFDSGDDYKTAEAFNLWKQTGDQALKFTGEAVDWRMYVPSAVGLESDLHQPTTEFRFRLWSSGVPAKLAALDTALSDASISYHIKSLGRSDVIMGLIRTARFRLVVSVNDSEAAGAVVRRLAAV